MDPVTAFVLEQRCDPAVAGALRRASSPTTQAYAIPYLAWIWDGRPWLRLPALRFAALAARARHIRPADGIGLARHLRRVVEKHGGPSETSIQRRLTFAAGGDVDHLHRNVRSLLTTRASTEIGLDFDDVWRIYRCWDHRRADIRRRTRERLIEDFFAHAGPPTGSGPSATLPS